MGGPAKATEDHSGRFRVIGHEMLQKSRPEEIVDLLVGAFRTVLGAPRAEVFFFDDTGGKLDPAIPDSDPDLFPDPAVIEFVFEESLPPTVPHEKGHLLTVYPLTLHHQRIGVLSVDVTGVAESIGSLGPDTIDPLLEQATIALFHTRVVTRSRDESLLLRNILESITNGILAIDLEDRIQRLNGNSMTMLGVQPSCIGRTFPDVLDPKMASTVRELIAETREAGFAMERVISHRVGEGVSLPLAISTSLMRNIEQEPIGIILILRDMTASRELDRLRKIDELKSEFVANVSHELRTPLTSIKSYTEALLDLADEEMVREFLGVIDEESDHLLDLINDLLDVGQIESGRMNMNFDLHHPGEILEEILPIPPLQSPLHTILPEIAGDISKMLLDKGKWKKILINLLSNAIKYSPKGGIIHVRMKVEKDQLRLEVTDPGMGISPEHLEKIFQSFYRVDSSLTTEISGTGLGLVIVKAIVEQHGGTIRVESEPGKGTTFLVLVPIHNSPEDLPPGDEPRPFF